MEPWQARASEFHPYLIAALEEIPGDLRALVEAALPSNETMRSGLVIPANYRSKTPETDPHMTPPQLLIFTDSGMWHIQAGEEDLPPPSPIFIDPFHVRWIRSAHLLLYGRLEIAGSFQGQPVLLDIEFNAVGWRQKDQNWRNFVARSVGRPPITSDIVPVPGDRERSILQDIPEKFVDGLF